MSRGLNRSSSVVQSVSIDAMNWLPVLPMLTDFTRLYSGSGVGEDFSGEFYS
jgi:hypothetical protein